MTHLGENEINEICAAIDNQNAAQDTTTPVEFEEPEAPVAPDEETEVITGVTGDLYMEAVILKGMFENEAYRACIFDFINNGLFADQANGYIFKQTSAAVKNYGAISDRETVVHDAPDNLRDDIRNRFDAIDEMPFNTKENQTELVIKTNKWVIARKRESYLLKLVNAHDNNNSEEIIKLAEELSEVQALTISGGDNNPLNIFTGTEFRELPLPEREFFLYPILPIATYNLTYSQDGVGKSLFWFALCDVISKGIDFGPWKNTVGSPVNILYIDGEMSDHDSQERMKQMEVNDNFMFIHCGTNYEKEIKISQDLNDKQFQTAIMEAVKTNDIKLVVFDNLTSLLQGQNENDKVDYDETNRFFLLLKHHHVASIVLHHANKSGDQSGTTSHRRNVDTVFSLALPENYKKEDGAKFNLTFQKLRQAKINSSNGHLVKTRELCYQQNISDQKWDWLFDSVRLDNDPKFFMDVISNNFTQAQLADAYSVTQGYISRMIGNLKAKELITKEGGEFNATDEGNQIFGMDMFLRYIGE